MTQDSSAEFPIFGDDRGDDLTMFVENTLLHRGNVFLASGSLIAGMAIKDKVALRQKDFKRGGDPIVVAGTGDGCVELVIAVGPVRPIVHDVECFGGMANRFEKPDIACLRSFGGCFNRTTLEKRTELEKLSTFRRGIASHPDPLTPFSANEESLRDHLHERFPDRDPADLELFRQVSLDEFLARVNLIGKDIIEQPIVHVFGD